MACVTTLDRMYWPLMEQHADVGQAQRRPRRQVMAESLIGNKYGDLTVISEAPKHGGRNRRDAYVRRNNITEDALAADAYIA